MNKPLFLTFEGIDGSGKSTQIKYLSNFLQEKGIQVYLTREPGGTPLAENLRNILLDPETGNLSPLSELFLYLSSRREHLDKIILPKLSSGISVISDRFVDSSVAYQGLGRGIDPKTVYDLNILATDGKFPDMTFLLDVSPEIGLKRVALNRKEPLDRLENEGIEFLRKIRNGYLWIAEHYPERVKLIDANQSKEETFLEIKEHLLSLL